MFDELTIRDARPILWLKRLFVVVIVLLLMIGVVSSHRAYYQVRSLELTAPHRLSAGLNRSSHKMHRRIRLFRVYHVSFCSFA